MIKVLLTGALLWSLVIIEAARLISDGLLPAVIAAFAIGTVLLAIRNRHALARWWARD